jgi:tetratricopeptide (TPR) repeat protein
MIGQHRSVHLLLVFFALAATEALAGVPQVKHRLEGYAYTSYRDFGRLTLRFVGGLPEYQLREEKDGRWTVAMKSTTGSAASEELSGGLIERVRLERQGTDLKAVLLPSALQGVDVQAISQGDRLLLDVLPRSAAAAGERLLSRGIAAVEEGRPKEALKYLRRWLRDNPDDARAYFHAGRARLALGDLDKARYNFLKAASDPTWRKETAKVLARMSRRPREIPEEPPAQQQVATPDSVPETARNISSTEVVLRPTLPDSQPRAEAMKPVVPPIDSGNVVMLLGVPLLAALGMAAGIAWFLLRRRTVTEVGRKKRNRRFREFLTTNSDAEELLEHGNGSEPERESVAPPPPVPPGEAEEVSSEAHHAPELKLHAPDTNDLFLPLNDNGTTRIEASRTRSRLRPDLRQLVQFPETDVDLREVARYLDVGLGEVELARALSQPAREADQKNDQRDKSGMRFGIADDES